MKTFILTSFLCILCFQCEAQGNNVFKGKITNKEYQIYIIMDFYKQKVIVKGEELFGDVPGYFGSQRDDRKWIFTSCQLQNDSIASVEITDDYGSEDLTATLTYKGNNIYSLTQNKGSKLKIAVNRKWVKIPQTIDFIKEILPRKDSKALKHE